MEYILSKVTGETYLKRMLLRFLMYFTLFFSINLIADIILKPQINILTAFSVALGVAAGLAFIENYMNKKS